MDSKVKLNKNKLNNKAQITIFVILAILIVVAIILILILFRNPIKEIINPTPKDPNADVEVCVNEIIREASEKIISIGGYVEVPKLTKQFEGKEVPYLCYTSKNDEKCNVVNPVIIEHLQDEIYDYSYDKINNCFLEIKNDLEAENYNVILGDEMMVTITLLPGKIRTDINRELKISKNEISKSYTKFGGIVISPIYEIFVTIQEITRQESKFCNSDYPQIMRLNKNIEVAKFQTGDDNKIYDVKDLTTNKEVRFAIRNCVLDTPG